MKAAVLGLLLLGATAATQQATFRSTGALVRIDVSVTDDKGPIRGLRSEDFVLSDNGVRQQPRVDELQDTPLDLVAVAQPLESLRRTSEHQASRLAVGFSAFLSNISDRDRLGVLLASTPPVRLRSLSFGTPQIDIRAIDKGDYAATFDAITAALGEFPPSDLMSSGPYFGSARRRVLVAFTNAADFRSTVNLEALVSRTRRLGPAFVLIGSPAMVKQTVNVGAETRTGIAIGESATALVSGFVFPSALELIAHGTGGITVDLGRGDPATLMKNAFAWMRTRYVLSYEPPAGRGWHALTVRVNRKGATVAARDGYFVE